MGCGVSSCPQWSRSTSVRKKIRPVSFSSFTALPFVVTLPQESDMENTILLGADLGDHRWCQEFPVEVMCWIATNCPLRCWMIITWLPLHLFTATSSFCQRPILPKKEIVHLSDLGGFSYLSLCTAETHNSFLLSRRSSLKNIKKPIVVRLLIFLSSWLVWMATPQTDPQ